MDTRRIDPASVGAFKRDGAVVLARQGQAHSFKICAIGSESLPFEISCCTHLLRRLRLTSWGREWRGSFTTTSWFR
jgi:hypothetical protein